MRDPFELYTTPIERGFYGEFSVNPINIYVPAVLNLTAPIPSKFIPPKLTPQR